MWNNDIFNRCAVNALSKMDGWWTECTFQSKTFRNINKTDDNDQSTKNKRFTNAILLNEKSSAISRKAILFRRLCLLLKVKREENSLTMVHSAWNWRKASKLIWDAVSMQFYHLSRMFSRFSKINKLKWDFTYLMIPMNRIDRCTVFSANLQFPVNPSMVAAAILISCSMLAVERWLDKTFVVMNFAVDFALSPIVDAFVRLLD